VEPVKDKIERGLYEFQGLENLSYWTNILELQFENLVLNNLHDIIKALGIDFNSIVGAGPYYQNTTLAQQGCQIDLLVQTKFSTLYLCEMKFKKTIGTEVIIEMNKKIAALKRPKHMSVRPVLIYEGGVENELRQAEFFDKMLCVGDLFRKPEKT